MILWFCCAWAFYIRCLQVRSYRLVRNKQNTFAFHLPQPPLSIPGKLFRHLSPAPHHLHMYHLYRESAGCWSEHTWTGIWRNTFKCIVSLKFRQALVLAHAALKININPRTRKYFNSCRLERCGGVSSPSWLSWRQRPGMLLTSPWCAGRARTWEGAF